MFVGKPGFDVIVCGSLHLDIVVHAQSLPRVDETARGSAWEQVCGGKGGNQAVQAARQGAKTAMIGRIGQDGFGDTLLKNLNEMGVDTKAVSVDPVKGSGMSVAILQENGEYGAVFVSGSNLEIAPREVEQSWARLGGGKVLILQNEVPDAVNLAAAKIAKAHGAMVVFNAAPARPLPEELSALVDVLVVNRIEAEALAGFPVMDQAAAGQALPKLANASRAVVITLGGKGLVLQDRLGAPVAIAPRPVTVTSAHGAGDCFVGVIAAELARGASLPDACRRANEKAADFVSRPKTVN
jgi:ribokinase